MNANDPLAPRAPAGDAFAGPVACITLIGAERDSVERFYSTLMEMSRLPLPDGAQTADRRLLALPEGFDWEEVVFWRPACPDVAKLRVLVSAQAGSPVRPEMDATLEGGLSVGFAMHNIDAVIERGAASGFHTTAGVGALDMQRSDGSPYQVRECHFRAPDDIYALGVSRPDDLAPIGPIEDGRNVGGPSYSGQVMNGCDTTLRFYIEVLGYELRRRMTIGGELAEKGLGLEPGTTFEFLQVFAPGSVSNYFIVLDFGDRGRANDAVAPPHRGVVAWTIPVANVDRVADESGRVGCRVIAGPVKHETALFGEHRVVSVATANGFVVECVQLGNRA